jgi:hypothetical protein
MGHKPNDAAMMGVQIEHTLEEFAYVMELRSDYAAFRNAQIRLR